MTVEFPGLVFNPINILTGLPTISERPITIVFFPSVGTSYLFNNSIIPFGVAEINVGKFPFSASGKANAAGHSDGFVKVIFDKKYGEWLGCHMVGYNVTEMIAEVVAARKLETTAHEIIKSVHPHPTMSEAIMEATAAAYNEVIHL